MLPGVGRGAELRIYDGAVTGGAVNDPSLAKATAVVTASDGVTVSARLSAVKTGASSVVPGDLAVVARPSDEFLKLRVRLGGGLDADRQAGIRSFVDDDARAASLIEFVPSEEDFELAALSDGRLVLLGPENRVRNTIDDDRHVAATLWRHARQRALLKLRGETGADFIDNETLRVQLIPARMQSACADGEWQQAPPNQTQVVPLCHAWNIRVTLSDRSPAPC